MVIVYWGCGFTAVGGVAIAVGGVASKHWAGLSDGERLLCIGSQVCGSRGVAPMHCGRGLAMEAWLFCVGGVALLQWGRGLEMRGLG